MKINVNEPEIQGHIHADLMAQYAEDAKTHPEPWKLWQFRTDGDWLDCSHHPYWNSTTEFRRKPKTHTVNGVEIPDFKFAPKVGERFYAANVGLPEFFEHGCRSSGDCTFTHRMIDRGLLYPYTEDGKRAAVLHAKAMLGMA